MPFLTKLLRCTTNSSQWQRKLQILTPTRRRLPTSQCQRHINSKNHNGSPYAILNVTANASKEEIKAAFRTLAKRHHPDLNRRIFDDDQVDDDNDDTMASLVNAYETLMSKYSSSYLSDATDSRVALACEIYTVDELRGSAVYDVYTFRINYAYDDDNNNIHEDRDTIQTHTTCDGQIHLDPNPLIPINAHPLDSISDLKRCIQSKYASVWGLEGRRRDRDGLYLGWELIHRSTNTHTHSVLSYHLFLESYGVKDGDILHAVVRK